MKHIIYLLILCQCLFVKSQDSPEIEDFDFGMTLVKIEEVPELIHITLSSHINKISGKEIIITEDNSFIYKDSSFADGDYIINLTKTEGDINDLITYGKLKGRVINGKKEGEWHKYLYVRGKSMLVKISNYTNGLLDGKYTVLDYDGDTLHYLTELYTPFGERNQLYEIFENGTGYYYDFYYDIGVLSVKGVMKDGKRQGDWYYYDRQGNKIRREYYNNGVLINE